MFFARSRGFSALFAAGLLLIALAVGSATPAEANPRYASIVVDVASGETLHARHADVERFPASLTKMMTLYMLFEAIEEGKLGLDTPVRVSAYAAAKPPSKLGFAPGETIPVRDAIKALIVRSANDVAAAVAEALGGSESRFAEAMTARARQLGMTRTTFRNASGLPDRAQISTARDMARLSIALIRDFPQYYHFFSTQNFTFRGQTYTSHNRLVRNYPGADGLKTGYIRASGFNVATSVVRDGRRLVAVVFGGRTAQTRDSHMAELLNRGVQLAAALPAPRPMPDAPPPPKPVQLAASDALVEGTMHDDEPVEQGSTGGSPLSLVSRAQAATPRTTAQGGGWGVQVGAFREASPAQAMALRAHERVAELVARDQVAVIPIDGRNGRLFRARLTGLQEDQARNACRQLASQGMECLVVRSAASGG